MPADAAIETQDIRKVFGKLEALRGVSFTVPRQSVFCILGPNGAGKSTLLRILTTVTRPTSGTAAISGFNIQSQVYDVRQRIGVVTQDSHFDQFLDIWHNLTLHAQMHGLKRDVYEPRIRQLLEQVDLYDRRTSMPEDLSGGMQRRIALVRALIHNPEVLFLDEPTTGLDPQARREIWETIEQFKRTATVVLTTHYMDEADRLSDRILMINHGAVVAEGTAQTLKRAISPVDQYRLVLENPIADQLYKEMTGWVSEQADLHVTVESPYQLALEISSPEVANQLLCRLPMKDVAQFGRREADLEDVFMSMSEQIRPTDAEDDT